MGVTVNSDTPLLTDRDPKINIATELFDFKMIHTSSRNELALSYSCLTATPQTTVTYHDQLDATIRLRSAHGKTPEQIAQTFSESGNFPMTVSYIEARLKVMPAGWLDAFTIDLYPEDVEKAFGGVSLSNSETQAGKPVSWNMHVDMFVSEIDADDAGVRDKVQEVCWFEPPVALDWLVGRLKEIAENSLGWVSQNGPPNESLKSRIRRRMAADVTLPVGSGGLAN